jgi:3-oxoacyl-[acyl-carrier-protein] synthase II
MKAPLNRRVFVVGYGAATALGRNLADTWSQAVAGRAGFRSVTRCEVNCLSHVVGQIPDWHPRDCQFFSRRDAYNWNAAFVSLTLTVCHEAIQDAGWHVDASTRTGCLIGSALNGSDSLRMAITQYLAHGPLKVSPYLLPNVCANLPAGKAGMQFGFTGPVVSPQSACASGNHAIGLGARLIRDGDCDFVLAGGVDTCLIPEIIHGFANMNATIKIVPQDRASQYPSQASRPFSIDRRGMVLAEGAAVLVLAAESEIERYNLTPRAEVLGIGWNSDER